MEMNDSDLRNAAMNLIGQEDEFMDTVREYFEWYSRMLGNTDEQGES